MATKNIIAGNGATEIIFLFFKAMKAEKALIIGPTFAEYERAAESAGTRVDYFLLAPEKGFKIDLNALAIALDKGYKILTL